jgi:hypothetical protein
MEVYVEVVDLDVEKEDAESQTVFKKYQLTKYCR